jgi:hypothetical protein
VSTSNLVPGQPVPPLRMVDNVARSEQYALVHRIAAKVILVAVDGQ